MIGSRISHFRILEKIGAGGMGEVYQAEDVDLGRQVAIKVLPPHLMDDESRRARFITEARTAAAVTHPNIATIHEIGEDGGRTFIAMELVQGRTLRSLVRKQPLELKEAVRIATEIASGLAAAHKARIAHRDLKPDNILLTSEGHVKILDFGLARLLDSQLEAIESSEASISATDDADLDETQAMTVASDSGDGKDKVLGTPAYMSPEQARGLDLDYRTDLFSFGCTFYEMLTGRPPFKGSNSTETLQEVLNKDPLPATHLNADLPSSVQWVLDKCLEKDPRNRYQDTRDLVVDLRHIHPGTAPQPVGSENAWSTSSRNSENLTNPFTGSVSTSVSSAEMAPPRSTNDRARLVLGSFITIVILLTVLSIAVFRNSPDNRSEAAPSVSTPPPVQDNSLAVFSFNNLQNPDDEERLGKILQELLITDLSGLDPLRVFSSQRLSDLERQVSFEGTDATFGETDTAQEVASLAGAQTMLTGTLSQLGERWILTANLTDVATGEILLAKRFDGTDLYGMVDQLTAAVETDFQLGKSNEIAARSIRDKTSTSMEAWNHYLDGIEFLDRQEFGEAVVELTRAVEIDPLFGQAYYQLGIATWWKYGDAGSGREQIEHLLDNRLYASDKERRMAKGMLLVVDNKWSEAIPALEGLARDYPDEKYAWYGLGEAQFHFPGNAQTVAAAESFEQAASLDPDFLLPYRHILDVMRMNHDYEGALQRSTRMWKRDPDNIFWLRQRVTSLAYIGDRDGTRAALDEALNRTQDPVEKRELYMSVFEASSNLGFLDWAEEMVAEARKVDPNNDIRVRNAYISLLWQRAKLDEVERLLSEWVEQEPLNDAARERLFELYMSKGEYRLAHRMALDLVEEQADDARWYRYWSQCAVYNGDENEVVRAMALALEHHNSQDDRRNLYTGIAWAYRNTGNTNKAIEYARRAMEIEPQKDFPNLWTSMARFELERGRFDEAEDWFRRAQASNPDNVNTLFSLARVDIARGRLDAALQHIHGGVALLPEVDTKHFLPISTMVLNGDLDAAESTLAELEQVRVAEPQKWDALFDDLGAFPPGLVWSYLFRGERQRPRSCWPWVNPWRCTNVIRLSTQRVVG